MKRRRALPLRDEAGDLGVRRDPHRVPPDRRAERGDARGDERQRQDGEQPASARRGGRRDPAASATATAAGPRKKLPCRFAQASTRSGIAQVRRGRRSRQARIARTAAKSTIPKSCARRPSAAIPTTNPASASSAAGRGGSQRRQREQHEARRRPPPAAARSSTSPPQPPSPWTSAKHDPGAPLLVEPRLPHRGERERVRPEHRERRQHQLAGPHLVGEIDRGHRGDRRRQGGQQDREGEPEPVAAHGVILDVIGGAPSVLMTRGRGGRGRRGPRRRGASPRRAARGRSRRARRSQAA